MLNTRMESDQSSVEAKNRVIKSAATLLSIIEKDLLNMDTKLMLILFHSLRVGIVQLEREMTQRGLTSIGLKTSDIS